MKDRRFLIFLVAGLVVGVLVGVLVADAMLYPDLTPASTLVETPPPAEVAEDPNCAFTDRVIDVFLFLFFSMILIFTVVGTIINTTSPNTPHLHERMKDVLDRLGVHGHKDPKDDELYLLYVQ